MRMPKRRKMHTVCRNLRSMSCRNSIIFIVNFIIWMNLYQYIYIYVLHHRQHRYQSTSKPTSNANIFQRKRPRLSSSPRLLTCKRVDHATVWLAIIPVPFRVHRRQQTIDWVRATTREQTDTRHHNTQCDDLPPSTSNKIERNVNMHECAHIRNLMGICGAIKNSK